MGELKFHDVPAVTLVPEIWYSRRRPNPASELSDPANELAGTDISTSLAMLPEDKQSRVQEQPISISKRLKNSARYFQPRGKHKIIKYATSSRLVAHPRPECCCGLLRGWNFSGHTVAHSSIRAVPRSWESDKQKIGYFVAVLCSKTRLSEQRKRGLTQAS